MPCCSIRCRRSSTTTLAIHEEPCRPFRRCARRATGTRSRSIQRWPVAVLEYRRLCMRMDLGGSTRPYPGTRKRSASTRAIPKTWFAMAEAYWDLGDDVEAERWLASSVWVTELSVRTSWRPLLYLERGDEASARRHAQLAADAGSVGLFLLRDFDLREGAYTAARARYAKAFPALFAKELPKFNDRRCLCRDRSCAGAAAHRRWRAGQALLDRSEADHPNTSAHGPRGLSVLRRANSRFARRKELKPLRRFGKPREPAAASFGATTATSTPRSPRSATNPSSRPSSPTSSATWRSSAPASPRDRRMRRLSSRRRPSEAIALLLESRAQYE